MRPRLGPKTNHLYATLFSPKPKCLFTEGLIFRLDLFEEVGPPYLTVEIQLIYIIIQNKSGPITFRLDSFERQTLDFQMNFLKILALKIHVLGGLCAQI